MVLIIWDSIICCGVEVMLSIAVALLGLLRHVLLTMHLEEIVCFFKMMRAEDSDCDAVAIAQMVVKNSHAIVGGLRGDREGFQEDSEGAAADVIEDASWAVDGQEGAETTASGSISATTSLLGSYLGQFSVSELPQGVFNSWGRAGA